MHKERGAINDRTNSREVFDASCMAVMQWGRIRHWPDRHGAVPGSLHLTALKCQIAWILLGQASATTTTSTVVVPTAVVVVVVVRHRGCQSIQQTFHLVLPPCQGEKTQGPSNSGRSIQYRRRALVGPFLVSLLLLSRKIEAKSILSRTLQLRFRK